jgi:hypothetical protein
VTKQGQFFRSLQKPENKNANNRGCNTFMTGSTEGESKYTKLMKHLEVSEEIKCRQIQTIVLEATPLELRAGFSRWHCEMFNRAFMLFALCYLKYSYKIIDNGSY